MSEAQLRELIGKYRVVRKLGEGATSEVFLCNDPFNRRDVAVKLVFEEIFSDPSRGRLFEKLFITEASLAGKLAHPHIVQIYDAVVEDKYSYIVMEYVEGGTLEKFCKPESLLETRAVAEIAFKCVRALAFAQTLGLTHRDIKPGNILHRDGT